MTEKNTRRGFAPDDDIFFSYEAILKLTHIQQELQWLLDHGYPMKSSLTFIGNHYQLSKRQRLALMRATAPSKHYTLRENHRLPIKEAMTGPIFIDGFNLIIPLEVALSGSLLINCNDNVIRDLAGLYGTYHIIDKTYHAIDIIGKALNALNIPSVTIYLDAPVSNALRLKYLLCEKSEHWSTNVIIEVINNVDAVLTGKYRIVTGDSILLDNCGSWFNLTAYIIESYIPSAWIISFK